MSSTLVVLSGGAAQGLVGAVAAQFMADTGCEIEGRFGPVGGIHPALMADAPADLVIATRELVEWLTERGLLVASSAVDVGAVQTAIAVRAGSAAPPVNDSAALHAALSAADEIYAPDMDNSTAGIHFAKVLDRLGLRGELAGTQRLKTFREGGAAAMRALAASTAKQPIGCTQVTEILATPGVTLVAPLPDPHGLATVYTAAVCVRAARPDAARALATLLAGSAGQEARRRAGFT